MSGQRDTLASLNPDNALMLHGAEGDLLSETVLLHLTHHKITFDHTLKFKTVTSQLTIDLTLCSILYPVPDFLSCLINF